MKTRMTIIALILLISFLTVGCSRAGTSSETSTIVCEVFYRPTAGQGIKAAPQMTFTGGNAQQSQEFENMAFEARFQDDQFEGRALYIVVTDLETGAELTRQLYQFDAENPVENQFIGGHGFTGLNYVFHPHSSAEMQFFCHVQEE